MNWENLLQPDRLGCPKTFKKDVARHEFQRDFDRIIFSTFFRRLQGKTQVFPFPETDTIHTRLTHSLEASSVGRSLGTIVGLKLKKKYDFINEWELGNLVSSACLAHDLGNPPLGHSGEDAIREYFNSPAGYSKIDGLKEYERTDFTEFESNALGFHFLTHSIQSVTEAKGGLSLTIPVLSTYCKYPRPSFYPEKKKKIASEKKPGLFCCDIPMYENEIANFLKIEKKKDSTAWYRHPLAFLNEAADDICYTINDFEDGYKHGLISYEEIESFFTKIATAYKNDIKNVEKIHNKADKIGYLRSKAINSLVNQAAEVFNSNEEKILDCNFDRPLCELTESHPLLEKIIDLSVEKIYAYKSVLQIETAGFIILPGLLDLFLTALEEKDTKKSASKILKLIPKQYILDYNDHKYDSIISIVGYIAGMTDNYAIDIYRNFRGIQLPNY